MATVQKFRNAKIDNLEVGRITLSNPLADGPEQLPEKLTLATLAEAHNELVDALVEAGILARNEAQAPDNEDGEGD
jgi:hypothetical protein